jgi:hypothetical protein
MTRPPVPTLPRSLRIGTWNVEYAYAKRLHALRDVLTRHDADIWILTETHDDLIPSAEHQPAHSRPRPQNARNIRDGSRWVTIWSRLPILSPVIHVKDQERTVCALLDLGGHRQLLVYGTVLPWKGDRGKFDWSEHHRVIPEQCAEWRALADAHPNAALCIAGDYNTDMTTGGYYGTKAGIAALHAGLNDCELYCATTASLLPADLLPYPPIDHIAIPEAWRATTSVTAAWPADKANLADHSGLVITIDGTAHPRVRPTVHDVVARATAAAFDKPLVTNVHRSLLVEAIIAAALPVDWTWCAADYASHDFRHVDGTRLEVKQAAALQTWNAASGRESKASFDIAPRTGEYIDNGETWRAGAGRNADIYVFAHHPDATTNADHRDPTQWRFFVVPETALPSQKSLAISGVRALAEAVTFDQLSERVEKTRHAVTTPAPPAGDEVSAV